MTPDRQWMPGMVRFVESQSLPIDLPASRNMGRILGALLLVVAFAVPHQLFAQPKKPAPPPEVTAAEKKALAERAATLREQVDAVAATAKGPLARRIVDLEIFPKAVDWAVRHDEYPVANSVKTIQQTADLGEKRIAAFKEGDAAATAFAMTPGRHVLGYRSKVDDSVQPYAVTLPKDFDAKAPKRWPLYVVLHGRSDNVNEAVFIRQNEGKPAPDHQTWIQLDVHGRGNNAYRWAGETDVFEAMADVIRRYSIDERRMTLWGFSMGGAGAWHLGLHHPGKWASVGAGAGFTDFYRYQKVAMPLPSPQDEMLRIYDAVGYAMNLSDVPFITYGGEEDPQLLASQLMQEEAKLAEAPLEMIIGPKMGHKFDPESEKTFQAFLAKHNQTGRPLPGERTRLRFATWTLKYNQCDWLTIEEQTEPYEKSTVESDMDGETLRLETLNVSALSVDRGIANQISIDKSEPIDLNAAGDGRLPDVVFVLDEGGWEALDYDDSIDFQANAGLRKRHNLQGPIDDAFMERFVCVRATGAAWSTPLQKWSDSVLARHEREFDKWMRARPVVVDDKDLSDERIEDSNLILFGDPGSNSVLAQVLDKLPIRWTKEKLTVAGKDYDPQTHGPVLIYPNPLNRRRYVVINSGHTFHEKEFRASNAQLYPRLADIAVIEFAPTKGTESYAEKPVFSDYFGASWTLDEPITEMK